MTGEEEINYRITINGTVNAYKPEQVEDNFRKNISDAISILRLDRFSWNAEVQTQKRGEDTVPRIGFYSEWEYVHLRRKLTWTLYERNLTNQLIELNQRIEVYERAISALKSAKLGMFGDKNQVTDTIRSLSAQKDVLVEIVSTVKEHLENVHRHASRESTKFDFIPKASLENAVKDADDVIRQFENVYIIDTGKKVVVTNKTDRKPDEG